MIETLKKHKRKAIAGGVLVAAAATALAVAHCHPDDGKLAAEDITQEVLTNAAAASSRGETTGKMVLDFVEPADGEGGSEQEIAALVAKLNGMPGVDVEPAGFYSETEHLFRLTATSARWDEIDDGLLDHELIEGVEPEIIYSIPFEEVAQNEPLRPGKPPRQEVDDPFFHYQWHMEQIKAPSAWVSQRGEGVIVAVIDTGVAWKDGHGAKRLEDLAETKFVQGRTFSGGIREGLDDHAHGSHVAGTIAQATNNGIGVVGVAYESTIMPLKVLGPQGSGTVPDIANAIRYAADNGAKVINMSLGGTMPSRVMAKAVEYAHSKGVIVVCAAGNSSTDRPHYPSGYKHAFSVASSNFNRELAWYSNYGETIDVTAPGGDTRKDLNGDGQPDGVFQNTIETNRPDRGTYAWFQGTSMAAPHAAGVAALVMAEGVTNPDEVARILRETAVHPKGKERDDIFGAGIIDAKAAVDKAHAEHTKERGGLLALLGLLSLGGFGLSGFVSKKGRLFGVVSFSTAALVASGALGVAPLAYGLASITGAVGSALWMSAAVPLIGSIVAVGFKPARPFLAGLALGYAAMLTHGAIILPQVLDSWPGTMLIDRLWMGANALVSLVLAARISRK